MPNITIDDVKEKRFNQCLRVGKIANAARQKLETGSRVKCCGSQPSSVSRVGHIRCGREVSIEYAYRCYYCGFYFCERCAAEHFGKTRAEHVDEFDGFDGSLYA